MTYVQKPKNATVHLFGEMDLNLSQTRSQILKEAGRIAGACGYGGRSEGDSIVLYSHDYDKVEIKFDGDDVINVKRSIDEGKTWETLNFETGIFEVDQKTLQKYNDSIPYGTQKKLPMSQGSVLNDVVKRYNITNAVRWGYHLDFIGIETPKQFLVWRDCGAHVEFLGIIDK